MSLQFSAVSILAIVCKVKLCRPVSHFEISDSRLPSSWANIFCDIPFALSTASIRSAMAKDNSICVFCSAGISASACRSVSHLIVRLFVLSVAIDGITFET